MQEDRPQELLAVGCRGAVSLKLAGFARQQKALNNTPANLSFIALSSDGSNVGKSCAADGPLRLTCEAPSITTPGWPSNNPGMIRSVSR